MFGDFYHNHKKLNDTYYNSIEDGTPIVRMTNYFPFYKFGIYHQGKVIQQTYYFKYDITIYEEMSFARFIAGDNVVLFEYTPKIYTYDKCQTLKRAIEFLGAKPINGAFSVFGDDFVFWCMVGERFDSFFYGSKMGYHVENAYREHGLKVHHHAIALEQDVVVHFHDDNNSRKTCICFSPYAELENPKIVPHKDENLQSLMVARNRAILAWTGVQYDNKYSIIFNNCEHLAQWCKTGKHISKQVKTAIEDIAIGSFCLFVPEVWPIALLRFKKYLF